MAPINAPASELNRSPAAQIIGALAEASDLCLAHFEHRHHLPNPEHWHTPDRPDVLHDPASTAGWHGGVLQESKYSHFHLDGPIGSFNPGHRAKWTAHELCHRLVGFGWRPGAGVLFHALAARLSEVLPVALYYFFDEAGLRRCPEHAGDGALFGAYCAACERAALQGPDPDDEGLRWLQAGEAYVHGEIRRVMASRDAGRPLPHRYATLDLCSDGVAYATSQRLRLASPEFAAFMERFYGPDQGWHGDLDALAARVVEVMEGITQGIDVAPWDGDRWRWAAQDLGWRLYQIRAETHGPLLGELDTLIEALADAPTAEGLVETRARYGELAEAWYLPEADEVFAVGYPLPDHHGRSVANIAAGLRSICPGALEALGESTEAIIEAFTEADPVVRRPLGQRFADFLAANDGGPVADLARFEATVAAPPKRDLALASLPREEAADERWHVDESMTILRTEVNVVAFAEAVSGGTFEEPAPQPGAVVVGRGTSGDVVIGEIPRPWADLLSPSRLEALGEGPWSADTLALPPEAVEGLSALGVLRPAAWSLGSLTPPGG